MFFYYLSFYSIKIIHFGIFNYIVLVPFLSNNKIRLLAHSYIIPIVMLHWYLNNDTCCLMSLEYLIRNKIKKNTSINDCITYKIISPIYKFNNNYKNFSRFSYLSMTVLFGLTIAKLLLVR